MEASAREQPLRASERPLRETGARREKVAASQEALIRRLGKTVIGERRGETSGTLDCQCSVPCMPVMSRAGNQVTWNHFLFWGSSHFPFLRPASAHPLLAIFLTSPILSSSHPECRQIRGEAGDAPARSRAKLAARRCAATTGESPIAPRR